MQMAGKRRTKFIHESGYVAEVKVTVIEDDTSWSPFLSLQDVLLMDQVREALKGGDVNAAARLGRVYTLKPVLVT